MDNINKINNISYRQLQDDKKSGQPKATTTSFSDIYNVELLSAQMNKNSSQFKLESVEEVNRELKNVIQNLDQDKANNVMGKVPSEDIIDLAKLMWKDTQ